MTRFFLILTLFTFQLLVSTTLQVANYHDKKHYILYMINKVDHSYEIYAVVVCCRYLKFVESSIRVFSVFLWCLSTGMGAHILVDFCVQQQEARVNFRFQSFMTTANVTVLQFAVNFLLTLLFLFLSI